MLGSVSGLWRYPVKSMRGEDLAEIEVTERGLVGDRAYALIDRETGKVASAKEPSKWGRLLECRATFLGAPSRDGEPPPVRIDLPGGTHVRSDRPDAAQVLSRALGRDVSLAACPPASPSLEVFWPDIEGLFRGHHNLTTDEAIPPGRFLDYAPVHLLTTSSIDRLRDLHPEGRLDVSRFRPNVLVDLESRERAFVEGAWLGRVLAVGQEVRLYLAEPCPRCVMITEPQGDQPRDLGLLRTLAQENRCNLGLYVRVLRGGRIRFGDAIRLE